MNIRPKTFVAVIDFSCAGQTVKAGDVVTGAALGNALRFGDRFVEPKREPKSNPTKADTASSEGA